MHFINNIDSIPWDQLLTDINKGLVLPIVGPALVLVNENGRNIPLIDAIVPDFAREHGIEYESGMTLNEAACKFRESERDDAKRRNIYYTVTHLIAARIKDAPVPQALLDLAAIRDFNVFITTTFDSFLTEALSQTRPGWTPENGRNRLEPNNVTNNIPDKLPGTFLYHILGLAEKDGRFAIWEEDYMEYLAALLMAPTDNRRNLTALLRNRSLLLIGSPFRDWFVRFFLFIAKRSSFASADHSTSAYFADNFSPDDPLVFYFDKVIGSPRVLPIDPCTFVSELRRRWQEKYTLSSHDLIKSLPADMPRGYVFISYASEDKEAAFTFALGLHNAGIPVWLDKRRLQTGTDWESALRRAIKQRAALFISLISTITEGFSTEQGSSRFVMKERKWAAERHEHGLVFYIPVIINPETKTQLREPTVFRRIQAAKLPDGKITSDFIARIDAYLKEYREKGEIIHVP